MKTNIKLNVKQRGETYYCRVKLDSNKFPYIVIDNEKIILNSAKFPRKIVTCHGNIEIELDMISGLEEFEKILFNPELTSDKLKLTQLFRMG